MFEYLHTEWEIPITLPGLTNMRLRLKDMMSHKIFMLTAITKKKSTDTTAIVIIMQSVQKPLRYTEITTATTI